MATASTRKLSKDERTIVLSALELLVKSQERFVRGAVSDGIRAAFSAEVAKTKALQAAFVSGELEL